MIQKLPEGTFLSVDESDEVMIIENVNDEDGNLKLTGISLLPWLNNRFVRFTPKHEDKEYLMPAYGPPGWVLWAIVYYMCVEGSPYLNGTYAIGIPPAQAQQFAIPGLGLIAHDNSGTNVEIAIPYGPVYNTMLEIALEYEIGMQITLESATDTSYFLGFRSYKGLDRTSGQTENQPVRFSPHMDSLTGIKELRSIAALKTLVYSFAQGIKEDDNPELVTAPGMANRTDAPYTGFDLRALMIFDTEISAETEGITQPIVVDLLNKIAANELIKNKSIKVVDGEIVPTSQFKYGVHYNLGDIIEVQGNSEIVQACRVTEYIRSQDEAGEKAYPTVTMID